MRAPAQSDQNIAPAAYAACIKPMWLALVILINTSLRVDSHIQMAWANEDNHHDEQGDETALAIQEP